MKATDLMIGDWINYQPGDTPQYMKVGMVSGYDIQLDLYGEGGIEMAAQVWFDEEAYIQPIPLTPEILEKNGWERSADHLWRHDDAFSLENDFEKGYWVHLFDSPVIYLRYVHELQHALRLCGIEKEIEL